MLKFKEVIIDYGGQILCTLEDGRCVLVDLEKQSVVVEILLDSFTKWFPYGGNENVSKENILLAKDIIETTKKIGYGPKSKDYLTNDKIKNFFDKLKEEAGYDY